MPPAQTSTSPGRLAQLPAVASALHSNSPSSQFPCIRQSSNAYTIKSKVEYSWHTAISRRDKNIIMGVPQTAWRHSRLPSGSVQAEVQPQNIRRTYFVQLLWGRILELLLNRCIVLWGSAKEWTVLPVLAKPHLLVISHTPHGGLERLMTSDKMQMIQLCNVQASFMLASPAAFSVFMGHCALVCLWYAEMTWQSRQQHFTFRVREGKEKGVTSSCLSHRTSGLLQRICEKCLLPIPSDQPPSS